MVRSRQDIYNNLVSSYWILQRSCKILNALVKIMARRITRNYRHDRPHFLHKLTVQVNMMPWKFLKYTRSWQESNKILVRSL